jgi:hypothetical protein
VNLTAWVGVHDRGLPQHIAPHRDAMFQERRPSRHAPARAADARMMSMASASSQHTQRLVG